LLIKRLKELLKKKLSECGWKEEIKKYTKNIIKSKGISSITLNDLIQEITPKAREKVPSDIKAEVLGKIKDFVEKNT
jgi:enhancer of yellow 2 transcription factor